MCKVSTKTAHMGVPIEEVDEEIIVVQQEAEVPTEASLQDDEDEQEYTTCEVVLRLVCQVVLVLSVFSILNSHCGCRTNGEPGLRGSFRLAEAPAAPLHYKAPGGPMLENTEPLLAVSLYESIDESEPSLDPPPTESSLTQNLYTSLLGRDNKQDGADVTGTKDHEQAVRQSDIPNEMTEQDLYPTYSSSTDDDNAVAFQEDDTLEDASIPSASDSADASSDFIMSRSYDDDKPEIASSTLEERRSIHDGSNINDDDERVFSPRTHASETPDDESAKIVETLSILLPVDRFPPREQE